jgi:uncharacterized membrane protein YgaE (UPF0421/DUF939 family)
MSVSRLRGLAGSPRVTAQRFRDVLWGITQASVAAGLAWYVAHDVLGHADPFFAPIAAAVCLSASNALHAQRAIQNVTGVAFGITLGAAVEVLLGTESIAIAVAVFVALWAAMLIGRGFIGQDTTFANQTASSAILVMALSGGDLLFQRLQEALIGGGLALVLSLLLFPANPLAVLRDARVGVWAPCMKSLPRLLRTRPAVARHPHPTGRIQPCIECTNDWASSSTPAPTLAM